MLDKIMPKMTGLDLLRAIREDIQALNTCVIVVSGEIDGNFVATLKREQIKISDVLIKPFDLRRLQQRIREMFADRQVLGDPGFDNVTKTERDNRECNQRQALQSIIIDRGVQQILQIEGALIEDNKDVVYGSLRELQAASPREVVIDLNLTSVIDAFGYGMLLIINGVLSSAHSKISVRCDMPELKERLLSLGIGDLIPIREPREDPFEA